LNSKPAKYHVRIGTRGSKLARWQADWTAARLKELGNAVEIIEIATRGDADSAAPINAFGGTGVFTKEIQRALLAGEVDMAVHSMKDLPTEPVEGLILAAVPPRESADDALVLRTGSSPQGDGPLSMLASGTLVGTGSLRRQALLRNARPDLRVVEVRGNVDTRLRKLNDGEFDALVLAEAGLKRLGLADRITRVLSPPVMLPAVGQGALAIESRTDDTRTRAALAQLNDDTTRASVLAERSLLAHLRGGCLAPIGASGRIENGQLHLSAVVVRADGAKRIDAHDIEKYTDCQHAEALGRRVAETLLAQGAAELIAASRQR
jgi:hydroxymethylbilane synthase